MRHSMLRWRHEVLSIPSVLWLQLSSSAPVQTADLALYRPALQRVAITKMLQQLSQVLLHVLLALLSWSPNTTVTLPVA
jgi:hypothetical protein